MNKLKLKRSSDSGYNFLWFNWLNESYCFVYGKTKSFFYTPQIFKNNDRRYFIWLGFQIQFGKN